MINELAKPEALDKEAAKAKVKTFVSLSQNGCDRPACLREMCKNNPGRLGIFKTSFLWVRWKPLRLGCPIARI
jgi:hypothetical protein